MIVTCDKCQSRFNLDETLIKESGAKVQCSNCRHVFMVHPVSGSPDAINIDDVIPGSEGVAINCLLLEIIVSVIRILRKSI